MAYIHPFQLNLVVVIEFEIEADDIGSGIGISQLQIFNNQLSEYQQKPLSVHH